MFLKNLFSSKTNRSQPKSMESLHPWRDLFYVGGDKAKPVILGKSGQLISVIAFAGRDVRTSADYDLLRDASLRAQILAQYAYEEGFVFNDDLTSVPSEWLRAPWFMDRREDVLQTQNPDAPAMATLISDERRERHSGLVEPIIFETITHQPSPKAMKAIKHLLYGEEDEDAIEAGLDKLLGEFNEKVEDVRKRLSDTIGRASRIDADQLYSYCYYVLTGLWLNLKAPEASGTPFGKLLGVERVDDRNGNKFLVKAPYIEDAEVHVRVLTPYGMPSQIRPEFFEGMAFLGPGIRWSNRYALVPPDKVRKRYTEQWLRDCDATRSWRQIMKQSQTGSSGTDPIQEMIAGKSLEDLRETYGSTFGAHLNSSVVIYRNTKEAANKEERNVERYLLDLGKPCAKEDFASKLSFASTVPGATKHKVSQDTLSDYMTVMSLPCSLPYTGPDFRGSISSIKESVAWQFTIKDLLPARVDFGNGQNRHLCITAPIRTGKSTLLQLIISFMLAHMKNPFVILIDVDLEKSASNIACKAMGGEVISFKDGTAAIQPFRDIHIRGRKRTAVRWVQQCIRAHGLDDSSPVILREIENAFKLLSLLDPDHRTVAQFRALVQETTVKACLSPFATGDFASHVGGNRNSVGKPPYVAIDCTGLLGGGALEACVFSALIDEISFNVSEHRGPVQLCVDEAVQSFPFIKASLKGAYKRWPKQGGGITIVIHDPKDLESSGETGSIIVQNTAAWCCLVDHGAQENPAYDKLLKLSDFQRALVSELKVGEFLLKAGDRVRTVQTDLSRFERWVLGQTGDEAYELANLLDKETHNTTDFCIKLLEKGGFHEEAKRFKGSFVGHHNIYGIAAE